ncbi:hypothetical protein LCGC14_2853680 [marine sediment metagenome]|uniref:Uncharacterized protein n=1 Tax=marine sediment metagenome TaxID=412755 RepID=A0A0F8Y7X3_9ZZZZ
MAEKREFGRVVNPRAKRTAIFEFDLEDLRWLQGCVAYNDGFYKDIQEAIDWVEEANA